MNKKRSEYAVQIDKNVEKFLLKHRGQPIIQQFRKSIEILKKDPFQNSLNIKTMVGTQISYRLRLGKYRFIYRILDDILVIHFVDADTRGDIY
ncbi:hypothetical protein MK079_04680 [Candidatus Gracilibacteria bacterium]|nr:hypothetical protein [Candidatus Gracilibacteria bacterium]